MGIRVGESNKLFGYNTDFDLSSETNLELFITDPDGTKTAIDTSRITAPAIDGVFNESGEDKTYLANEYMQFTILATDFTVEGVWEICGIYTNTVTNPDQIYHGDSVRFRVEEAC